MTTKDTRARRARKGGRAHRDTLGEAEALSSESSLLEASDPKNSALLQTIDEECGPMGTAGAGKSPSRSLLHRLPTPVRDRSAVSPPLEKQQQEQERQAQGFAAVASVPVVPQCAPKVPEPWGLQDATEPQQAAQQAGYRDRLRARGQQAMQRGPAPRGAPPGRPQLPAAAPSPAPALPPMLPQGMAPSMASPSHAPRMSAWSSPTDLQMQQCYATASYGTQCFGTTGMEMSPIMGDPLMQGAMSPDSQDAALSFFGCQQGAMTPMESQQATMSFFSCQPGPATPVSAGQQTPMSYFGYSQQDTGMTAICEQGQPAPVVAVQQGVPESATPLPCSSSSSMSQVDDLMAKVMDPDASFMDREQIADYLRAAAPCCYDD